MKLPLLLMMMSVFTTLHSLSARALFEPPENKKLLIIGQDIGAIGGFPAPNNDGYLDHGLPAPAGVTTYLSLPELRGMTSKVNLRSGDLWAQGLVENPALNHSVLSIGLHMVGQEEKIAAGKQDAAIETLAQWIKSARRPVFLRIGYEFDGSWNRYKPGPYREAFRRIVTIFRQLEVTNCAYVWQSCTSLYSSYQNQDIADWYPGDDYVDWMGYSWFLNTPKQIELTDRLLAFARARAKPVIVCEAAPQGYDIARLTRRNVVGGKDPKPKTPEEIWSEWYAPFFAYIEKNADAVKAVAYINVNWDSQPMWGPPYRQGYWGDSRVQANPVIKTKWLELMSSPDWLHASPDLFRQLNR